MYRCTHVFDAMGLPNSIETKKHPHKIPPRAPFEGQLQAMSPEEHERCLLADRAERRAARARLVSTRCAVSHVNASMFRLPALEALAYARPS